MRETAVGGRQKREKEWQLLNEWEWWWVVVSGGEWWVVLRRMWRKLRKSKENPGRPSLRRHNLFSLAGVSSPILYTEMTHSFMANSECRHSAMASWQPYSKEAYICKRNRKFRRPKFCSQEILLCGNFIVWKFYIAKILSCINFATRNFCLAGITTV